VRLYGRRTPVPAGETLQINTPWAVELPPLLATPRGIATMIRRPGRMGQILSSRGSARQPGP